MQALTMNEAGPVSGGLLTQLSDYSNEIVAIILFLIGYLYFNVMSQTAPGTKQEQ